MNAKLEQLLDKLISKMENGNMDWRKTWKTTMPCNYATKRAYSGVNLLSTLFNEFESPYYLTFNQVKELGGSVKKGSKGTEIVFWQPTVSTSVNAEGETEERNGLIFRLYYVFNAEQIEGIEFETAVRPETMSTEFYEDMVMNMPSSISTMHLSISTSKDGRAYYSPAIDNIKLPAIGTFRNDADYLATLFHEAIHATGHKARLNRLDAQDQFNRESESYSVEELTAEFGACFLCNHFGIENDIDNSAKYLKGWAQVIKEDKKMIMKAASAASKAMAFILQESEVFA